MPPRSTARTRWLEGLHPCGWTLSARRPATKLVQNPAVPREERLAMLDEAFGAGVHVYVLNFLKILCGKSALGMAAGCLQEYKALLYEARGILPRCRP